MAVEDREHSLAISFLFFDKDNRLLSPEDTAEYRLLLADLIRNFYSFFQLLESEFDLDDEDVIYQDPVTDFPHPMIIINSSKFHLRAGLEETMSWCDEQMAEPFSQAPLRPYLIFWLDLKLVRG